MSQATVDGANAAIVELSEKLLKLANLQADTALKEQQTRLNEQQTRYLPWQVWTAGAAAGAALMGAAVGAGVALAHWH